MQENYVCITGASRGIGLALVQEYLKRGKRVLAISRNTDRISIEDENLSALSADIATEEGRKKIASFFSENGSIHTLIHNAGKLIFKPFREIEERELKSVYEVNVFAPFLLTCDLYSFMNECHVINISSVGGVENSLKFGGLSAYSSSKAALNCLTQMWAEEFKDSGHTFNCLALGSVQTEMFEEAFPEVEAACTPETMAKFIADFDESARSVMNGKIISVNRSNP